MRINIIIYLFLFLTPLRVFAYESFFEYSHFDGSSTPQFFYPYLLNIEYQTNLLSYGDTPSDIYDFIRYPTVLYMSGGSADRHHLLLDTRFKFTKLLDHSDSISFFFQRKRNFEEKSNHAILEYRRYFEDFFVGLFLDPDFIKQNISFGVNLNYQNNGHLFRLFATKVDIFRLIRSDLYPDDDPLKPSFYYYDSAHQPLTIGFVNRIWSNETDKNAPENYENWGNFLEYGIKYDFPTYWNFITDNYQYKYQKKQAFFNTGYRINDYGLFFAGEYIDKKESYESLNSALADKAVYHGNVYTTKFESKAELKTPMFESVYPFYISVGYNYVNRNWKTLKSDLVLMNNVLYSSFNFSLLPDKKNIWLSLVVFKDWYQQQGYWNDGVLSDRYNGYTTYGNADLKRINLIAKYYWPKSSSVSILTSISFINNNMIYGGTNLKYEYFY